MILLSIDWRVGCVISLLVYLICWLIVRCMQSCVGWLRDCLYYFLCCCMCTVFIYCVVYQLIACLSYLFITRMRVCLITSFIIGLLTCFTILICVFMYLLCIPWCIDCVIGWFIGLLIDVVECPVGWFRRRIAVLDCAISVCIYCALYWFTYCWFISYRLYLLTAWLIAHSTDFGLVMHMIGVLIDCMPTLLHDCLLGILCVWFIYLFSICRIYVWCVWLCDWFIDCLDACLVDCLTCWLIYWVVGWWYYAFIHCLIAWLLVLYIAWFTYSLVDWHIA